MIGKTSLPIMAGLAVAGAVGGVVLGHSAVSEIDPAYYSSPPTRFHADQAANRSGDWAQVQVQDYEKAGLADGLGQGCYGCRAGRVEYHAAPAVTTYGEAWVSEAVLAVDEAPAVPAEAVVEAPDPELERVQLYASYPVSAEEEAEAPPPDAWARVELGTD
jgi:hypothetical protein